METTELNGNLQPAPGAAQTGNPQNLANPILQPQTDANGLQITATQTINQLNSLDRGNVAIKVDTVSTTVAKQTAQVPEKPANYWLTAGIVLVVVCFVAALSYSLLRQK